MSKKINTRRTVSLAVIVLGVILIIYALSAMHRISNAKGTVNSIGERISDSSFGRFMTGELNEKASQYDTDVLVLLIIGSILVIVGCSGTYYYRK